MNEYTAEQNHRRRRRCCTPHFEPSDSIFLKCTWLHTIFCNLCPFSRWFRHIQEASNTYRVRDQNRRSRYPAADPLNGVESSGKTDDHLGLPDVDKKGQPAGRSQSFHGHESSTSSRELHTDRQPSSPPEERGGGDSHAKKAGRCRTFALFVATFYRACWKVATAKKVYMDLKNHGGHLPCLHDWWIFRIFPTYPEIWFLCTYKVGKRLIFCKRSELCFCYCYAMACAQKKRLLYKNSDSFSNPWMFP